ncbi:ABC transporter ATP-binding protein [Haloterrigena alkaliphila]|uniref:Cobalamin import ATP-binding protein BtuD n=1 Tax=Haloterrigena alkaliphila TaxID=2816475 RepID=A0A8A2VKY2_9EURY|nr:ATP-binding cassette domain-containing protein [Haloterrigena alkaliphila]QSW98848.1 ATP-binding cassette domain-containing protein [Haloterrigena alkaliphila]
MTPTDRESGSDREPDLEPASISIADCSLSFGDLAVLEDVSLAIEPGEFVGFVGPNGAGKTTLLRLISGALEPDSGSIAIDGTDMHGLSSRASSRLVSVVPQDTTLSFSFPVRDVVEMGRHPHRSRFSGPTAADREAVERALERTRTDELAARPIDEVSGGQRQRVVLARAIAQETPVMLLDEPTGSLDVNHQIETLELVRELVSEGRTVCAAIHDLDLAARYCDRLVMLADGAVSRTGPPAEVLTGESLSTVFDATAAVTRNPITGTETVTALPNGAEIGTRTENGGAESATGGAKRRTGGDGEREGRIHVVGTGPIASSVLARLETAALDLALSVGPVTDGDTAAETARSLEIDRLEVKPFESLSAADLTAFEERVRSADVAVVTEPVWESTDAGVAPLLESLNEVATPVVIVSRSDGDQSGSRAAVDTRGNRAERFEATPETILEVVGDALESSSTATESESAPPFDSSDGGSTSSEGDSGTGVSAGSSSD